jgi:hypothetical protein
VSTAALLAATKPIRGLSEHPDAPPDDGLLDDLQQAAIRPEDLTQTFATLPYGFLQVINDANVDLVVGSVTPSAAALQLVPEVLVTRMDGAMGAAAAGQSPLGGASGSARCRPPKRSPWPIPPGCWPTCSTTSAKRAGSGTGSATGSSSCSTQQNQTRTAESDADQNATDQPSRRLLVSLFWERGVAADQGDRRQVPAVIWAGPAEQPCSVGVPIAGIGGTTSQAIAASS